MGETVVVSGRGADRLERGHPWVYRGDVVTGPDAPGAYPVMDDDGRFLATGFFSPRSKITLRAISRERVDVDAAYFRGLLERVAAHRARWGLHPDGSTTCFRLVHAEADGLPGVIVDRYGDHFVLQISNAGADRYTGALVDALVRTFGPASVLARHDIGVRRLEGLPQEVRELYGEVPGRVEVLENGVRFEVDLLEGQKTGAYLDQKAAHALAATLARGRALDLFTYQGWFAVQMATAAATVTAVDSSGPALEQAQRNAALNGVANLETVQADVFGFLDRADGAYDTIVLDPPPFAKRKGDVRSALGGYTRLNARCLELLAPGGRLLTFSCSHHVSPAEFMGAARRAASGVGRRVRVAAVLDQPPDHPHVVTIPESGYLKGLVLEALD